MGLGGWGVVSTSCRLKAERSAFSRRGARRPLQYCRGTLEQGTEPQMLRKGPVMSWKPIQMPTCLMPECSCIGLQHSLWPRKGKVGSRPGTKADLQCEFNLLFRFRFGHLGVFNSSKNTWVIAEDRWAFILGNLYQNQIYQGGLSGLEGSDYVVNWPRLQESQKY